MFTVSDGRVGQIQRAKQLVSLLPKIRVHFVYWSEKFVKQFIERKYLVLIFRKFLIHPGVQIQEKIRAEVDLPFVPKIHRVKEIREVAIYVGVPVSGDLPVAEFTDWVCIFRNLYQILKMVRK